MKSKNATPFDHSSVFWILNAPLTQAEIVRQVQAFKTAGFTSVLPCPVGAGTTRKGGTFAHSGMGCAYLSEEFFRQYTFIVEACREVGLAIWVWDDDLCPAGWLGGLMIATRPDLRGKVVQRIPADQPLPAHTIRILAEHEGDCYALVEDGAGVRVDVYHPDSGRLFVELNYEKYRTRYAGLFGKTIVGMFTDEPGIPGCLTGRFRLQKGWVETSIPWTDDTPDRWREQYGSDLVAQLPLLFAGNDNTPAAQALRTKFGVLMHDLWITRWMQVSQRWCAKQGLLYTGHMNNDDYVEAHLNSAGDLLECIRHFDIPAVDTVVSQIVPDKEHQPDEGRSEWDVNSFNSDYPRFASSAARGKTTGRAACELGSAYGWGTDLELRKWLLDYHIARGIDFIHWGCIQYSQRGHDIMCDASHFGEGQPFWPFYRELNRYQRQVLELLARGKRCAETAVFFPARGYMAGYGEQLNEKFEALAAFLRRRGVDFDYVGTAESKGFAWRQIFVPGDTPLAPEEQAWLAQRAQQCEVLAPEDAEIPGATAYCFRDAHFERGAFWRDACTSYGELARRLRPDLNLGGRADISFHPRRLAGGGKLIFVFNEGTEPADEPMAFEGLAGDLFRLDYAGDAFESLPDKRLRLDQGEAWLVFAGSRAELERQLGKPLAEPWPLSERVELRFAAGKFLRAVRHGWDGTAIREVEVTASECGEAGADFSGMVERRFEVKVTEPARGIELALTGPRGVAAIRVNGHDAGAIIWPPRRLRLGPPLLTQGVNVIEVAIHNTLANHTRSAEFRQALARRGVAENQYHRMTEALDRQLIAEGRLMADVQS